LAGYWAALSLQTSPIERPARFELVVNLKIAKGPGMTIPKESCCAPTRSLTEEERLPVLADFVAEVR